ncbi:hypothetical protein Glove_145g10 [Diversispora epigaea]|uniref:Uncharacterized protein n=1 Tax=Diversispora epigaea TaxID=1348612 RepID=A0A397ITZ0_9GLOM|nr:hypothetical protein Glove_145g10 [Diversispora epigaea]
MSGAFEIILPPLSPVLMAIRFPPLLFRHQSQKIIPATQIQNSNAKIPNAEIPNTKSQIIISIFCRNPKSQIPNTSNLCILTSQIPNYLGFGQHVYLGFKKNSHKETAKAICSEEALERSA